jgi:intracellular septation protein
MTESTHRPEPHPASQDGAKADSQAHAFDLTKLLIELGPLVVFFAISSKLDLFYGTGAFMAATAAALVVSRLRYGRVPVMPLVSGALVLVFGGLTLYLKNEVFIMMKPTILYTLFTAVLLGGLMRGISLLRYLFGEVYNLTDTGWRLLTFRWAFFFLFLAVLNELIWRNTSEQFWLRFKVFGVIPLTMAFALAQMPLLKRHAPAGNS